MKPLFSSVILTNLLLLSCANPVTPTGGPKDEKGPVLLKTTINNKSIQTKPEKITFYFDENIQVTNPKEKINISPLPKKEVKFTKANKSITIEFPSESLTENTTYNINISEAVTDLNEVNKTDIETFVFSTGNDIDTLSVSGTIIPAQNIDIEKIKILLYQDKMNTYKGIINKNKFTVTGIKNKNTSIIAVVDANNNNAADSTENFGYYTGNIKNDSIQITVYSVKKKNIETFTTQGNIYVTGLPQTLINTFDKNKVSQYKDTVFTDTLLFQENILKYIPEVYFISSLKNKRNSSFQFEKSEVNTNEKKEKVVTITFNENISSINFDSIYITDNEKVKTKPKKTEFDNNILTIIADSNQNGTLHIGANSIVNQFKNSNSASIKAELNNIVSHGTIEIQNPFSYPVSVEISNSEIKKHIYIKPNSKQILQLKEGNYKGNYFIDENYDFLLTPPVLEVRKGETWALLPDIISDPKLENVIILQ